MKKIATICVSAILAVSVCSCSMTQEEVKIDELKQEITVLEQRKSDIENIISSYETENDLTQYVVQINIRQSHFSLDVFEHIKDEMNDVSITVPVSKVFYDTVSVGDVLDDSFRLGSLIMNSSIGSWKITISDKYTV